MGCRMDVVLAGMRTWISFLSPPELLADQVYWQASSDILKEIFFFWVVGLKMGLNIYIKSYYKEMCYYLGFVVPFI